MTDAQKPTEQGIYTDPANGDMWELNSHGWRWINGNGWSHVPSGLIRTGDTFEQRTKAAKT